MTSGIEGLLVRHVNGDVCDPKAIRHAMEACQPDIVFHLAAQTLVRQAYADARGTFDTNVMGTVNVLDAVRSLKRPCTVIVVTSDKCYENGAHRRPHLESDPLGGGDPYSASKAAAEIITEAYRSSFFRPENVRLHGVKLASVRAGNAIGGGDWAKDRIVPDSIRALMSGRPVRVRNPGFVRPWQHVLEPLSGYLALAGRMVENDGAGLCSGWNFGPRPEDEATVQQLVQILLHAWGGSRWECAKSEDQPREDDVLRLSADKAERELGWTSRWRIQETARRTVEWYVKFLASPKRSTRDACMQDIVEYEAVISNEDSAPRSAAEHAHRA